MGRALARHASRFEDLIRGTELSEGDKDCRGHCRMAILAAVAPQKGQSPLDGLLNSSMQVKTHWQKGLGADHEVG
jgi:hypothetical protein